ncbi:MAG: NAD-dependent epimerase/dehydratase family protein [Deltaproteobacteria bacterium]|nr:NAD-dependent epimerase/dehydratase family protein [Deltaproteobacteria bacterium]
MAKVFITGGAGLIGYYITKNLLSKGHEVIIYDAFLNYVSPFKSKYMSYLEYRLNDIKKDAKTIRGDIRHRGALIKALSDTQPNIVIHLAAIPIASASNEFSEDAIQINLNGTVTLLECLRVVKSVDRFLFSSSSFVYGDFAYEPADEEHKTCPIDVYGGTKLCGEVLTKAFGKKFGIGYTIIRPSAVYGPTDANRRVSQIFIESALLGQPLTLHNKGVEKVDFTYVEDVAEGFVLAAFSDKAKNETFNITRGQSRTIKDFAYVLGQYFPQIHFIEAPSDEERPQRGALDITKAGRLLDYYPKTSLEQGIPKYIEFLKEHDIRFNYKRKEIYDSPVSPVS